MASLEQKWPSRLVLARHGESKHNVLLAAARKAGEESYGGAQRDMSSPLTERGRRQAECVAEHLAGERFDRIFSSPYRRCRRTAELIRARLAEPPAPLLEERLREREFGIWDGLTRAGRMARHPEEFRRFRLVGKYYYRPPGGESYPDVGLRVHSFLGTLARECRGQAVLVITHSVVVLVFRRLLERLSESELLRIDADPEMEIRNCSLTEYRYDAAARKLRLLEFAAVHYPEDLILAPGPRD